VFSFSAKRVGKWMRRGFVDRKWGGGSSWEEGRKNDEGKGKYGFIIK
jgi:hypothetical protein